MTRARETQKTNATGRAGRGENTAKAPHQGDPNGGIYDETYDKRLREAMHLQYIEDNPLSAECIAMFEMFKREGFTSEQSREYILAQVLRENGT